MSSKVFSMSMKVSCMAVIMLAIAACSSDDKDEPAVKPDPSENITDVFERDKAKGSISQEEFENKVMGKVWYYSNEEGASTWVDKDGNVFDWYQYAPSGWLYNFAYYFDAEKYLDFRMQGPGQGPYTYCLVNRKYQYDPATGIVSATNGFAVRMAVQSNVLFYIESVNGSEMVIHDLYINPFTDTEDECTLHSRRVLKAATPEEAERDWWSKYTPVEEDELTSPK